MNVIHTFKNCHKDVTADLEFLRGGPATLKVRIATFLFYPGFRAVFLYRIQKLCLDLNLIRFELLISNINYFLTGTEICAGAKIDAPMIIRHPSGIVIGGGTTIGKRATILQGSTMGQASVLSNIRNPGPIIGDDVIVGANSSILGSIFVANGSKIGAHSLLLDSTKENGTYVGNPAREINRGKTNE